MWHDVRKKRASYCNLANLPTESVSEIKQLQVREMLLFGISQ